MALCWYNQHDMVFDRKFTSWCKRWPTTRRYNRCQIIHQNCKCLPNTTSSLPWPVWTELRRSPTGHCRSRQTGSMWANQTCTQLRKAVANVAASFGCNVKWSVIVVTTKQEYGVENEIIRRLNNIRKVMRDLWIGSKLVLRQRISLRIWCTLFLGRWLWLSKISMT